MLAPAQNKPVPWYLKAFSIEQMKQLSDVFSTIQLISSFLSSRAADAGRGLTG
jgi:hypothetical protein